MLNEALRLIRVFHDMKTSELAKELAMSTSYLSEIERGKKSPTVEIVNKYGVLFDIKPSAILFFSETLESNTLKDKAKNKIRNSMIQFLKAVENAAI